MVVSLHLSSLLEQMHSQVADISQLCYLLLDDLPNSDGNHVLNWCRCNAPGVAAGDSNARTRPGIGL
jgi:hypothetical protein